MANWKRPDITASTERAKAMSEGTPLFKPAAGEGGRWKDNWIRILPPREDLPNDPDTGKTLFYYPVAVHFYGANRAPFVCLRKMYDEPCPACAQAREQNDGKGPRWYAAMNVVVLDDEGAPKEKLVRIWPCPRTTLDDLAQAIEELPEDERDITDPDTGRPVLIRRKGTGTQDTRYQVLLSPDAMPFEAPELLETMNDLVANYEVLTAERMLEILAGPADPFAGSSAPAARARLGAGLPPPPDEAIEGEVRELAEEPEASAPAPAKGKGTPTPAEEASRTSLRAKLRKASAAE